MPGKHHKEFSINICEQKLDRTFTKPIAKFRQPLSPFRRAPADRLV
jgi:hypothetical protein